MLKRTAHLKCNSISRTCGRLSHVDFVFELHAMSSRELNRHSCDMNGADSSSVGMLPSALK